MSKIYIATVTLEMPIYAHNETEAKILAEKHARDELRNGMCDVDVRKIETKADVPEEMKGCICWGDEDEKEIEAYLK